MRIRLCASLLTLMLFAALPAGAAGEALTASGTVVGGAEVPVRAPYTGVVAPFTLRAGDEVAAGQVLFSVETDKIYAPEDGVASFVPAAAGDDAGALSSRYGGILLIEPALGMEVVTDAAGAYNDRDNRYLHAGETVYLESRSDDDYTGTGCIIKVSGEKYTVQITGGNLRYDESVYIFRDDDYDSKSRIGKGDVTRVDPIAVSASGTLLRLHVAQGDAVKKGDLLAECTSDALSPAECAAAQSGEALAESAAVVSQVLASQGAKATKGQALATLYLRDGFRVKTEVSEADVSSLKVGQKASVTFEDLKLSPFEGEIESISGLSEGEDGAFYAVYLTCEMDPAVRVGMSARIEFQP